METNINVKVRRCLTALSLTLAVATQAQVVNTIYVNKTLGTDVAGCGATDGAGACATLAYALDFRTLQHPSYRDDIQITDSSTYTEKTTVLKPGSAIASGFYMLGIRGTQATPPTIDWLGTANPGNVTSGVYENLIIQNSADANLRLYAEFDGTIRDVTLRSGAIGLAAGSLRRLRIEDCTIENNSGRGIDIVFGISCFFAYNPYWPLTLQMSGTVVANNDQGMVVYPNGLGAADIDDCEFTSNTSGAIYLRNGSGVRYGPGTSGRCNDTNVIEEARGSYFTNCSFVNNGAPTNLGTITIIQGFDYLFQDCLFDGTKGHVLKMYDCTDNLIERNVFAYHPGDNPATQAFSTAIDGASDNTEVSRNVFFLQDGDRGVMGNRNGGASFTTPTVFHVDHNTFIGTSDLNAGCSANSPQYAFATPLPTTSTFTNNIVLGMGGCSLFPVLGLGASQMTNNDFFANGSDASPSAGDIAVNPELASLSSSDACGGFLSCATPATVLNGDSDGQYMGALYLCPSALSTCCKTCAEMTTLVLDAICMSIPLATQTNLGTFLENALAVVVPTMAGEPICEGDPAACQAQIIADLTALIP